MDNDHDENRMLRRCAAQARPLLPHNTPVARGLAYSSLKAARSPVRQGGKVAKRSTLAEEEKQVKKDVADLTSRLSRAERRQESRAAEAHLPELDDATLDSIYEALSAPEPATEEDRRLARRQKRLRISDGSGSHLERIEQRLQTLYARLDSAGAAKIISSRSSEGSSDTVARLIPLLLQGYQDVTSEQPEEAKPRVDEESLSLSEESDSLAAQERQTSLLEDRGAQHQLLDRISALLASVERRWGKQSSRDGREALPIGVATTQEWEALAVAFARHDDYRALEKVVELMQKAGQKPQTKLFDSVLDVYANRGDVEACQSVIASLSTHHGLSPDEYSFHCLAKAYLRRDSTDDALALITQLEDETPASMATYTMVAQHLSAQKHSAIWPLFYRMRLVAHPVPDAPLYATMIRACANGVPQDGETRWQPGSSLLMGASGSSPTSHRRKDNTDAERALDLFREMTTRYQVRPTAEVYNAVILACARRNDMLDEAFRLLRTMVDFENERSKAVAEGEGEEDTPSFAPDRQTYNALLHGCARIGDVVRARWILAEMLRHSSALLASKLEENAERQREWTAYEIETIQSRRPDAETMCRVFHAYASYEPPVKESRVKVKEEGDFSADTQTASSDELVTEPVEGRKKSSFSFEAPKTSSEVVREVKGLMARIEADLKDETQDGLLSSIKPDARLINSYLSAIARHSDKRQLVDLVEEVFFGSEARPSLFGELDVQIKGTTYMLGLELCAKAPNRKAADVLVSRLWNSWAQLEDAFLNKSMAVAQTRMDKAEVGVNNNTVSRCWAAMIRNLTKSRRLDEALLLLRTFIDRNPPRPSPNVGPLARSASTFAKSTTAIVGPTSSEVVDSRVFAGPALTFAQLRPLHQALVEAENRPSRKSDLAFLSWASRAYDATERARMPAVFSNKNKMSPADAAATVGSGVRQHRQARQAARG